MQQAITQIIRFMKLRELLWSKKLNNKGSAIILVIIAMAFIGILASLILWMAYMNYYMKLVNMHANDNFYSAEQVVEEIRAGLQDDVAQMASESYSTVLQRYSELNTQERKVYFTSTLIDAVYKKFNSSGSGLYKPKDDLADIYVEPAILANATVTGVTGSGNVYSSIIYSIDDGYVILRDVDVKYEDSDGYISVIHTDFRVSVPDIDFSDSPTKSELFAYGIIATDELMVPAAKKLTVNGCNIYAGGDHVDPTQTDDIAMDIKGSLVTVDAAPVDGVDTYKTVIAGKNVNLDAGAKFDGTALFDIWAQNLTLDGAGSVMRLNGKSYVSDDLTLNGNNSEAVIKGSYYGYGTDDKYNSSNYGEGKTVSIPDPAVKDDTNPYYTGDDSSAILMNGRKSKLDLSGLNNLWLMGRSYIGTRKLNTPAGSAIVPSKINIPMSESVSIRGDQVAYLVPSKCIAVWDGISPDNWKPRNPMTMDDYTNHVLNYASYGNFKECDLSLEVDELGTSVESFGANTKYQKVFTQGLNGNGYVYYYVVLDSADANSFFKTYYDIDKSGEAVIDKYANRYVQQIVGMDPSATLNIAGNFLTTVVNTESEAGYDLVINEPDSADLSTLSNELAGFVEEFACLDAKLITKNVSAAERAQTVFENLVIEENIIDHTPSNAFESEADESGKKYKAIIVNGDYTYSGDSDIRLILATGDITIASDFEGCAFAKGNVEISGDVKVTNDTDTQADIQKVLSAYQTIGATKMYVYQYFRDGSSYIVPNSAEGTSGIDDTEYDMNDVVQYENWTKNGI